MHGSSTKAGHFDRDPATGRTPPFPSGMYVTMKVLVRVGGGIARWQSQAPCALLTLCLFWPPSPRSQTPTTSTSVPR